MPTFESPEQYIGDPADLVKARRVEGYGAVRLEPNDRQPGMPPCDCHPADPDQPETSLGIIHEGDVVCMTRGEAVGFFRETAEGPVWNAPRADFAYVAELDDKDAYAPKRAPRTPPAQTESTAAATA